MNIRTVIFAACAGTLMLTATLARAGEPIDGVDVKLKSSNKSLIRGDTGNMGNARSAKKTADNESPRPGNRKNQQQKTGPGTGKSEIFDRWGNSRK